jgi:L-ribulose-5-phosphate 3-epimerase
MFDIGIITDQVSMDFEKALRVIKESGLRFIEIHALWNKNIEELIDDEIIQAQKLVKKYGLEVSNISSTLFLQCDLEGSGKQFDKFDDYFITIYGDYQEHMKALEKCIKLCDVFHTDKIRIFGFRKEKAFDIDLAIEMIAEKLQEPVKRAEEAGIKLILENCPHTYIESGSLTKKVLTTINSKYLRALWDPGNALRKGVNPYPDDYNNIKGFISHIHAKDFASSGSEHTVTFGEGIIQYRGILKSLIDDGYEGVISVEPEYEDEKGGREESSKQCISGIKQLLSSLM